MSCALALVRRCRNAITQELMKSVIHALVLSQMEYCNIIWSNACRTHLAKLQVVQNKAARLILQCSQYTSITHMHSSLHWLKVEDKLMASLLTSTWAILNNKTPLKQYNRFCKTSNSHIYNTRSATTGTFVVPRANTNALQRTVGYRAITAWNSMPTFITQISSKASFKKQVKIFLGKSYF